LKKVKTPVQLTGKPRVTMENIIYHYDLQREALKKKEVKNEKN